MFGGIGMFKKHFPLLLVVLVICCFLFGNKENTSSNDTFVAIRPPNNDGDSDASIVIIHECSGDEDDSVKGFGVELGSIIAFDCVRGNDKEDDDAHKTKHHKKGKRK